jgi:hypothetical protein
MRYVISDIMFGLLIIYCVLVILVRIKRLQMTPKLMYVFMGLLIVAALLERY